MRKLERGSLIGLALALLPAFAQAKVIHTEKSLYRNIIVDEQDGVRCLKFSLRLRNQQNQSCLDLRNRQRLVFEYAHLVMAGLFVNPQPKKILILGLGGGTLPKTLHELFPDTEIDSVEIDEAVVHVAKNYFDFDETPQLRTHIRDGRLFVKQALRREQTFDFIVLDAFNGDYIPEHMMTREFLEEVKGLLTPDGVVVANTFSTSRLYDHESVTYQSVFGQFLNVVGPDRRNRIIVAQRKPLPGKSALAQNAANLDIALRPYGVNTRTVFERISDKPDWDSGKRPLTDQYSPVNLLKDN